jgi:cobalt-zinc-cadmium efflux system membrane fusion protein
MKTFSLMPRWNSFRAKTERRAGQHLIAWSRAISLVAALAFAAGCKKDAPEAAAETSAPKATGDAVVFPPNSPQLSSVEVAPVGSSPRTVLRLHGRLVWDETTTARVFTPFAGRANTIVGEVGKTIERGGTLAMIASPDFGQAQADARRAANDLRQAERTLARVKELFENGAAPRKDLDAAEADQARALAERERAETRLALYGAKEGTIDQSIALKSPVGGVIVEKNLNLGQEVRPDQMLAGLPQYGAPLFVITDPTRLWVLLDATEADICHLKPGSSLVIRSQASTSATHPGRLEVVSDSFDPNTRMLRVRGSVDNSDRALKAEMLVTAELEIPAISTRSVASHAVFLKGDKHFVYVEQSPGRFERRQVKVGAEIGGKLSVLEGLDEGQRIVTRGGLLIEQIASDASGS